MGLDLFLGILVLVAAIRGWFKGFVLQAVRLGGLVACVYEAGPVRDFARPHLEGYLKGIKPELLDRLLWWSACVVCYVVTVGLATWMVRVYRRRPYGEPDLYRGDQAAGFMLGAAKGAFVAMVITAALDRYALGYIQKVGGWPEQQATASHVLVWSQKYRPAARFWALPPVQNFVGHVQRMGLTPPESDRQQASAQGSPDGRGQSMELPHGPDAEAGATPPPTPGKMKGVEELEAAIDRMRDELHGSDRPN